MQTNQKINAYTIAEMLVVLVVSSIVITLALLVLNLVQKQIHSIRKNIDYTNEIINLERALWNDFNSRNMIYNKKKDELLGYNSKDTVTYYFDKEYVLRNKDTLKIGIASKELFLAAEKVNENSIDALELTLTNDFQNKNLFIFTKKDASYYMNH